MSENDDDIVTGIDPEAFEALQLHLKKQPNHVCPVCNNDEWSAAGLQMLPAYLRREAPATALLLRRGVVPVVVVICSTCFYTRQFAWLPIWKAFKAWRGGLTSPTAEGGGE